MARDHSLASLRLPAAVERKLKDLAIRGVRQLHARLTQEGPDLQHYLELSAPAFADLCRRVEETIRDDYPEDLQPQAYPNVNKTGVAVERRNDPNRPTFDPPEDE